MRPDPSYWQICRAEGSGRRLRTDAAVLTNSGSHTHQATTIGHQPQQSCDRGAAPRAQFRPAGAAAAGAGRLTRAGAGRANGASATDPVITKRPAAQRAAGAAPRRSLPLQQGRTDRAWTEARRTSAGGQGAPALRVLSAGAVQRAPNHARGAPLARGRATARAHTLRHTLAPCQKPCALMASWTAGEFTNLTRPCWRMPRHTPSGPREAAPAGRAAGARAPAAARRTTGCWAASSGPWCERLILFPALGLRPPACRRDGSQPRGRSGPGGQRPHIHQGPVSSSVARACLRAGPRRGGGARGRRAARGQGLGWRVNRSE